MMMQDQDDAPAPPSSPPRHIDTSPWQCCKCNHTNTKNKKRCSACQAWKGLAPLVALNQCRKEEYNAANIVNHTTSDGSSSDENTHPNFASTRIRIYTGYTPFNWASLWTSFSSMVFHIVLPSDLHPECANEDFCLKICTIL